MKWAISQLLLFAVLAAAQSASTSWMMKPVDVLFQRDPVPALERKDRDAFADQHWGVTVPPRPDGPAIIGTPKGEVLWPIVMKREAGIGFDPIGAPLPGKEPELPNDPRGIWLVAKFEGYRTILSSSERSIYTEISYRIQRVIGEPKVPNRAGELLDVARNGGTIKAPWGQVISHRVPTHYPPQPGHTYLLVVTQQQVPNMYLERKRWDVTTGAVVPDTPAEVARTALGTSKLSGLTVAQAVEFVDKELRGRASR